MSGSEGTSNGASVPPEKKPFPRLSSFKLPRDLTLGAGAAAAKPNKKVFTPNLNVVRNKNKAAEPNLRNNKKEDRHRRDKNANKSKQNGPSVLKSSGVFSEGLGASVRHSTRSSYSREVEAAAALARPALRLKDVKKIDKEMEEQKIKRVLGESHMNSSDDEDSPSALKDAPIRLPVSAGGTLYSAKKEIKKLSVKMQDVVIKKEPEEDSISSQPSETCAPEVKANVFDSTDIVGLLKGDKPAMILLQLPDNLPGRGADEESPPQKKKQGQSTEEETKADNRCKLSDLEEGKIGKILVYKSGKVKMVLGETTFDLTVGTQPCFRQDAVSVAADEEGRSGTMINLGRVDRKLNVIPDWEAQFNLALS